VLRRVWAPRGQRPIAPAERRYQWLYVYGFVRPATGQSWWCLLPTVSTAAFAAALAAFAHDEGIDAQHRAVLILDNAGWHTTSHLPLPAGIDLVFLPPASPELQPAERVWGLINEVVANQRVADLAALEAALMHRCRALRRQAPRLQSLTHYRWWPLEPQPTIPQ
jgi:transposase